MRLSKRALIGAIAVLLVVGAILVFSWEPETDFLCYLPNYYRLVRLNGYDCHITMPEYESVFPSTDAEDARGGVPPNIVELNVKGDIVFGRAVDPGVYTGQQAHAGFFILDTASGARQIGLAEDAWRQSLRRQYGIVQPDLIDRWDLCRQRREETRRLIREAAEIYRRRAQEWAPTGETWLVSPDSSLLQSD